jgi:hypothetical protein
MRIVVALLLALIVVVPALADEPGGKVLRRKLSFGARCA